MAKAGLREQNRLSGANADNKCKVIMTNANPKCQAQEV